MDAKKVVNQLNLNPYKCRYCAGVIGLSNEVRLYVGPVIFLRAVTMECGYCQKYNIWRPATEDSSDKNKA